MIYKQGQTFEYEGRKYTVGDMVIANAGSMYEGLMGRITEIRTEEDKDTDNVGPDIYCDFEKPQFPFAIQKFQEHFHVTVDETFDWDMVSLDSVIMAPEMIELIDVKEETPTSIKVYVLSEEWVIRGDAETKTYAFLSLGEAKKEMQIRAYLEKQDGIIKDWLDDEDLIEDTFEMSYSAYIEGWYCDNHYDLSIATVDVPLTSSALGMLNIALERANFYQDIYEQVIDWEDFAKLTPTEQKAFLSDPSIPERIEKRLQGYKIKETEDDIYTLEISEVAATLLSEYLARKKR